MKLFQTYQPIPPEAAHIHQVLLTTLTGRVESHTFMKILAETLHSVCGFSWLIINVKGQHTEMFADFSRPGQQVINSQYPVLDHSLTVTIAEHLRGTRKALVIPDCVEYFLKAPSQPIFQQKICSIVSIPLVLGDEVFATLNLGFELKQGQLDDIAAFVNYLSPVISVCLGIVLAREALRRGSIVEKQAVAEAEAEAEAEDSHHLPDIQLDADVVFRSKVMREIIRQVNVITNIDVPVLLLGETGTGKNMIARYIHDHGLRRAGNFVRVNCPAMASGLFESEMFGHAKGSFTGATKNRVGRFELAHKGTLFLDEMAELSMDMQSKLLQVLDDSSFERVGESKPIMVDMRIVAATNVHIGEAIKQERLRMDLFHRISVYTIELPPLRQRVEDIPVLAMALSVQSATRLGLPDLLYTSEFLDTLAGYYWPGNTRELSNFMTRMVIAQNVHGSLNQTLLKDAIEQSESYFVVKGSLESGGEDTFNPAEQPPLAVAVDEGESGRTGLLSLDEMESRHILKVLEHTGGVVSGPKGAARILNIPRSTLINRMRKLGLRSETPTEPPSPPGPGPGPGEKPADG